jgi:hypothetical protein
LTPPISPDQLLLLGEDDDGLGAVGLLADQDGSPEITKLVAIAVSTKHRRKGGHHADEAIEVMLQSVADRLTKTAIRSGVAVAEIHPDNHASKNLSLRHGLEYIGISPGGLELWGIAVELDDSMPPIDDENSSAIQDPPASSPTKPGPIQKANPFLTLQ